MKTNYQSLTAFDVAAVSMVMLGLALIGAQFWVLVPDQIKTDIVDAAMVLDMNEAWQVQLAVNEIVLDGTQEFMDSFARESIALFSPMGDDIRIAGHQLKVAIGEFARLSDALASNYQVNYVQPGVEANMGGKVMGAYFERLEVH